MSKKAYEITAFEPTLSLVGSEAFKTMRRSLLISCKAYKESPKAYANHCIQLEDAWQPADYQQLRIVYTIASMEWLRDRLLMAITGKQQRHIEQGEYLDKAIDITARQQRSLNSLDKTIIRNIDLLRRLQGKDPSRIRPTTDESSKDIRDAD